MTEKLITKRYVDSGVKSLIGTVATLSNQIKKLLVITQTKQLIFTITEDIPTNTIIDIDVGGIGDEITMNDTEEAFNLDGNLQIYLDGILQIKGTEVIWNSENTLHFPISIPLGSTIVILQG